MAKNRSNGRDITNTIASSAVRPITFDSLILNSLPVRANIGIAPDVNLNPVDDRRTFDPTRSTRSPSPQNRNASRIRANTGNSLTSGLRFNIPGEVPICARRKQRREVLHALRLHKRRGRGGGKPKFNLWSKVKC